MSYRKRIDSSDLLRDVANNQMKIAVAIGHSLTLNAFASLKRDLSPAVSMAIKDLKRRMGK